MDGEFLFFSLLIEGFFVKNDLVSINQMLFKFMGKDAFYGVYSVWFTDFGNKSGNLIIVMSWFD